MTGAKVPSLHRKYITPRREGMRRWSSTLAGSAGYRFDPASGNTVTITFAATRVRYVRLTFTANTGWPAGQVSEFEVYAS